jgi:hypothetical protein
MTFPRKISKFARVVDGSTANLSSLNGGALAGIRNKIINGGFDHWQRGTTSTSSSSSYRYTADRWRSYAASGAAGTATVSRIFFTAGQTDVPGEPAVFLRWNQTVAPTAGLVPLTQPIEDARTLAGKTATLSFFARAPNGSRSLTVALSQIFGSGGSASTIVTQAVTLSTAWEKFTLSFDVPSADRENTRDRTSLRRPVP